MIKISFNYDELLAAADFVKYCDIHNVKAGTLQNNGFGYHVTLSSGDVRNLNQYLLADRASTTLNRIINCLLDQANS